LEVFRGYVELGYCSRVVSTFVSDTTEPLTHFETGVLSGCLWPKVAAHQELARLSGIDRKLPVDSCSVVA
jgi:hypothetical protein